MIVPVPDEHNKDEEAPADYNQGGYLVVRVKDTFKDGRYVVLRKLGYVRHFFRSTLHPILDPVYPNEPCYRPFTLHLLDEWRPHHNNSCGGLSFWSTILALPYHSQP